MENLLHEFFNSKSDANKYLEASEQEDLEKSFQEWHSSRKETFESAANPLIKYLAENHHPHTCAIVESDGAILWEGLKSIRNDKHIQD